MAAPVRLEKWAFAKCPFASGKMTICHRKNGHLLPEKWAFASGKMGICLRKNGHLPPEKWAFASGKMGICIRKNGHLQNHLQKHLELEEAEKCFVHAMMKSYDKAMKKL